MSNLEKRLNPCFSGSWFLSKETAKFVKSEKVLILVLVEVGF